MVRDAGAEVVVTERKFEERLRGSGVGMIVLEEKREEIAACSEEGTTWQSICISLYGQRAPRLHIEFPRAQPFHLLWVTMVKETAGSGVQCCNGGDVIRAQVKVEHLEILHHSFFAHRLGQDHDAAL